MDGIRGSGCARHMHAAATCDLYLILRTTPTHDEVNVTRVSENLSAPTAQLRQCLQITTGIRQRNSEFFSVKMSEIIEKLADNSLLSDTVRKSK